MAEQVENLLPKVWQNFFAKFAEIQELKNSKWKDVHQLAYLTQRYEKLYGKKFVFSLKGAPSKCPEMVFIKKMCAMLGTSNARTIREYIDWVFDKKIIPNKMKIRSLTFFMTPGLGNEFYLYRTEQNRIDKTTQLPNEYKEIIESLGLPVSTYGDLAFAKLALDQAPESPSRAPYKQLFNQLFAVGFELEIIKDLK